MPGRVLSSEQAKTATQQVQAIINGGLNEQIAKLDAQGKTLSNPDVWDGPLAQQFRDQTWPETKSALDRELTGAQLRVLLEQSALLSSDPELDLWLELADALRDERLAVHVSDRAHFADTYRRRSDAAATVGS